MDAKQQPGSTVLLTLPGWSPANTVLEITSMFIDTVELPPNDHFLVFKPEDEGDPCWWYSPDIEMKYKPATQASGIELQFPLFQIISPENSRKLIYKHIIFFCRERYLTADSFENLQIEEFGTGIILAVQLEFIKTASTLKQTPSWHMSANIVN